MSVTHIVVDVFSKKKKGNTNQIGVYLNPQIRKFIIIFVQLQIIHNTVTTVH